MEAAATRTTIKANELRIGNYLFILKVYPIVVTADHIKSISEGDTDYTPIPLTPDILQKCGFEFEKSREECFSLDIMHGIYINAKNGMLWLACEGNCVDLSEPKQTYLHQIQNLYFAFTGEELEISL